MDTTDDAVDRASSDVAAHHPWLTSATEVTPATEVRFGPDAYAEEVTVADQHGNVLETGCPPYTEIVTIDADGNVVLGEKVQAAIERVVGEKLYGLEAWRKVTGGSGTVTHGGITHPVGPMASSPLPDKGGEKPDAFREAVRELVEAIETPPPSMAADALWCWRGRNKAAVAKVKAILEEAR